MIGRGRLFAVLCRLKLHIGLGNWKAYPLALRLSLNTMSGVAVDKGSGEVTASCKTH